MLFMVFSFTSTCLDFLMFVCKSSEVEGVSPIWHLKTDGAAIVLLAGIANKESFYTVKVSYYFTRRIPITRRSRSDLVQL